MRRRARRATMGAALAGAAVIAILVAFHWGTVRDHVEVWHFQFTRETMTAIPGRYATSLEASDLYGCLADGSGRPVIFDPNNGFPVVPRHWGQGDVTVESVSRALIERGYRVLEQRFPRRAYVVMRDNP